MLVMVATKKNFLDAIHSRLMFYRKMHSESEMYSLVILDKNYSRC